MNDQQPEELNQNTTMNTVTYATRTETSDLQFEGDVTSIRHNGECLLEKVERLEKMAQASANQIDRLEKLAVGQEEISRRLRDHQKATAKRSRISDTRLLAVALACLCLATWIVNRMVNLPEDTAQWQAILSASQPRAFDFGQAVINRQAKAFTVHGVNKSEHGWVYKLIDREGKEHWKHEHHLSPVKVDGQNVFKDLRNSSQEVK